MRISEQGQLRLSVLISYVQMALAIVLSILYTPFALKTLDAGGNALNAMEWQLP